MPSHLGNGWQTWISGHGIIIGWKRGLKMYQFKLEGFSFYKITAVADNIFKVVFSKMRLKIQKIIVSGRSKSER